MKDIIPRHVGRNDAYMVESLNILKDVLLSEKKVMKTVNKKKVYVSVRKYKDNKEVLDRINRSIEYYSSTTPMVQLRDYQKDIVNKACDILTNNGLVYLAMEVRTGKTITSLSICTEMRANNVLFVTKKKALLSITEDHELIRAKFYLETINYESLSKVSGNRNWDIIILDEAHCLGAFPKPSSRAKEVADLIRKTGANVILLSGTPTPESYSQIYHQVYGCPYNPFAAYKNFYSFAKDFVTLKTKKIGSFMVNDYSTGKDEIMRAMDRYMIPFSQKEAGFSSEIKEHILTVDLKDSTLALIKRLEKNLVVEGKEEVILADTAVKLQNKLHQLYSGTIKFESGNSMVIDTTKAEFIREKFMDKRIGMFYKFKEELNAIKSAFGDEVTTELKDFKSGKVSNIALQIVSGREGISLKEADALVYYNIDFSATSYWQSRDRMTTIDSLESDIYWVFSRDGIEEDIYKSVSKKKDYTVNIFKKKFNFKKQ